MKHLPCRATKHCQMILSALVTLIFTVGATAAWAQTTAFTYQGKLNNGGVPANGTFEMQFQLFDALAGGAQVGTPFPPDSSVAVINGIFTTTLDFGAAAFDGSARFLEIGIRPAGNPNPFTILSPRQPIKSAPYAIRSANAATADTATNATQLGGVDASQYVTATTGATNFIQNATTQQANANFNISGNGLFGGNVGIGLTNPEVGFKFDVNGAGVFRTGNGRINFSSPSSETGMSIIPNVGNRADVRFDGLTLKLSAGLGTTAPCCGIAINTAGNVGIGTTTPSLFSGGTGRFVSISDSNNPGIALTNTGGRQFFLYSGGGSGSFRVFDATSGVDRFTLDAAGNIGIGTTTPAHRLSLIGGPQWTSNLFAGALELGNASAIGWRANAAGNRFGIGQSTGGLYFFATLSDPGTTASPANYVMQISDTGNITQPINNNGLVKAMIVTDFFGSIVRCYNAITNSSVGTCGLTPSNPLPGVTRIDFGFDISNRFVSVTPEFDSLSGFSNAGANYRLLNSTTIEVFTFRSGNSDGLANARFTLIMY